MELAFGARLPGHTHLQLHELNPALTRTTELPIEAPQRLGTILRCSTRLASLYGPTSWVPASLTRIHDNLSTMVPTPIDYAIYNIGAHSYLPLLYGPSSDASPSTRNWTTNKGQRRPRYSDSPDRPVGRGPWAPVPPSNRSNNVPAPDGYATAEPGAHLHLPALHGSATGLPTNSEFGPQMTNHISTNGIARLDPWGYPAKHSQVPADPYGPGRRQPHFDSDPDS